MPDNKCHDEVARLARYMETPSPAYRDADALSARSLDAKFAKTSDEVAVGTRRHGCREKRPQPRLAERKYLSCSSDGKQAPSESQTVRKESRDRKLPEVHREHTLEQAIANQPPHLLPPRRKSRR
jgi:hypothetical protein